MFRCRLIRTVVNLSLIVVMMIQPGVAAGFAGDCGAECASAFMCEGCGCCEVSTATERCCCCQDGLESNEQGSCCMGASEPMTPDAKLTSEAQTSDIVEIRVIVISTAESIESDSIKSETSGVRQSDGVSSACFCGFDSQPIGEPVPSRPTIERRDSVSVRFSDLATIFGEAKHQQRYIVADDHSSFATHFSQIQLCIWRL